jgi:hypothetical protein
MPNVLTAVPSRQRTEALRITLTAKGVLGGGESVESRPVRSAGYNAVVGMVVSDVPGTVLVQGAPEVRVGARRRPGTFVTIATIPTTPQSGVQAALVDEEVRGDFIRVVYVNGPALQTDFQFSVYLVPVFAFKTVTSGGTGPGGSIVIAGEDSLGAPVVITVTPAGAILIAGSPGATITTPADTAVGVAATELLPAPPAGTRRMTVEVTGGDSTTRIRVREAGGVAGAGTLLLLFGSATYGGQDGAVAALEVENVAGPAASVMVQFEGD